MRTVRISEDIVPISDFEARAAKWLKRVAETWQPVVITQNGKAAGVLVSPSELRARGPARGDHRRPR
jgi:prevent-host-death family protein